LGSGLLLKLLAQTDALKGRTEATEGLPCGAGALFCGAQLGEGLLLLSEEPLNRLRGGGLGH